MDLPIFPLQTVLFPGMDMPLRIFEPRYKQMLRDVLQGPERQFGVVLIRSGQEVGGDAVPYGTGTLAEIRDLQPAPGGQILVNVEGTRRFDILEELPPRPYPAARIRIFEEKHDAAGGTDPAVEEAVRERFERYFHLAMMLTDQWARGMPLPPGGHALVDFIGPWLQVPEESKQQLLEPEAASDRLNRLSDLLERLLSDVERQTIEHRRQKYGNLGGVN